jgi:hypothetical protein
MMQGPSWVNRATLTVRRSLPVFPDLRTFSGSVGMSHRCQRQISRPRGNPAVSRAQLRLQRISSVVKSFRNAGRLDSSNHSRRRNTISQATAGRARCVTPKVKEERLKCAHISF